MKKTLLIVLSLVFASLLLIVSCDNSSDAPSSEVVIPSLPEGSPSISTDDLTEITKKPEEASDSDIILLDAVLGELQDFAIVETDGGKGSDLSKEARDIVYDFLDAFGKQGIELKGNGYSLAFNADIKSTEFTVSGSFDNFEFGKVTLNGKVNSTIAVNEEYDPHSKDSLPFIVVSDKEKTDITVNKIKYNSLGGAMNAVMENLGKLVKENPESLIGDVNEAIPGLIDAVNGFIADYSVSSDMLTVALNGKITNGGLKIVLKEIQLGEKNTYPDVNLGEGLRIDLNTTAYTNKPLEYNGSEYKFFVCNTGTMNIVNNPKYDIKDAYNDPYYKEPKFNAIIEDTLNVILETSGKIENQKIRLQAKFSGDILNEDSLKVEVLVDLNGKVLDLSELQK